MPPCKILRGGVWLFSLECPLPADTEVAAISEIELPSAATASIRLVVTHYAPLAETDTYSTQALALLPWRGLSGGDTVSLAFFLPPHRQRRRQLTMLTYIAWTHLVAPTQLLQAGQC